MTANVEIEVARNENALTIPVQAVVYRKRRDLPEDLLKLHDERQQTTAETTQQSAEYIKLVFCAADGKARPLLVDTGISDPTDVEITAGLAADDAVIIGPYRSLDQLKADSPIKLKEKKEEEKAEGETDKPAEAGAEEPSEESNADAATTAVSDEEGDEATSDASGKDDADGSPGGCRVIDNRN